MMAVNVVIVVLTFWACAHGLLLADPCTLQPDSQAETITIPSQCITGEFWLDYPQGSLQVNFQQDRAFTVCLTPNTSTWEGSIAEQVDGRKVFQVDAFVIAAGGIFCMPRAGNQVTVVLEQIYPKEISMSINFEVLYK